MLVTAFICYKNGLSKKTHDHYLAQFHHLAMTGLPILCFLDECLRGRISYPNVRVEYTTIDDLHLTNWIASQSTPPEYVSPGVYGSSEYFVIQNSKTELMVRAMSLVPNERLSWVDFGIAHIFEGQEQMLRKLAFAEHLHPELVIPGFYPMPTDSLTEIKWRFLGGFFTGTRAGLTAFHDHQVRAFKTLYPIITYEANLWAWAEVHQGLQPKWYRANFSAHILDFDRLITNQLGKA